MSRYNLEKWEWDRLVAKLNALAEYLNIEYSYREPNYFVRKKKKQEEVNG